MSRWLLALVAVLVAGHAAIAGPRAVTGPDHDANATALDGNETTVRYRHTADLGVGLSLMVIENTELGRATAAYGYQPHFMGTGVNLGSTMVVLPWLRLGGKLGVRYHGAVRTLDNLDVVAEGGKNQHTSLWRITPMVTAELFACLERGSCDREGLEISLHLAIGGGATLWTWRGETESGAHFWMEAALQWTFWMDQWGLSVQLAHAGIIQRAIGPQDLGHPLAWSPTTSARLLYRW